ncbi:unnamed protein product [Peniophora sp. CBMAI 1063]|nr:unnamed protein product [Peniophora sp. CBMAI 1063]
MPIPLAPFPVTNADLMTLDARVALPIEMSFMKNVLLCGINNVATRAPKIKATDAAVFSSYVSHMLDIILIHIRVNKHFFTTPLENGLVLTSVLGPGCTPDSTSVCDKITRARDSLKGAFDGKALVGQLNTFADELRALWHGQLAAITGNVKALSAKQTDTEVRAATRNAVMYFASQSDPAFLVPFILSHHDRATSKFWPPTTPEGWAALPALMKVHADFWNFVPFDPTTGAKRP